MDSSSAALLAAAIAALVAVAVFLAGEMLKAIAAAHEKKRALVSRMLDTLDDLIRRNQLPAVVRTWKSTDLDMVLTLPRLTVDLSKRDMPIADWVWAQTQRLVLTVAPKEFVRRATRIQGQLVLWSRGAVSKDWFQADLRKEPILRNFSIPKSVKWKRTAQSIPETTLILGLGAAVLAVCKTILK